MPGGRAAIVARSSRPRMRGVEPASDPGMAAPKPLERVGLVSVSVGMVGSFARPRLTDRARGPWVREGPTQTERPFLPEGSRREVPYRAGEPARNWHLAGVAAGRLSWLQRAGPSATLDKAIQLPT